MSSGFIDDIEWKNNEHKQLMRHLFWADAFAEYADRYKLGFNSGVLQ